MDRLKAKIAATPDFPKPGILFQDIFPLFQDPKDLKEIVSHIVNYLKSLSHSIDVIVGLDSRGFLLGPWIAHEMQCAFVPVRKQGKLPPPCHRVGYTKEYGTDYFEISHQGIQKGHKVVVLDDLIATGGSAKAAGDLVKMAGGTTIHYVFFVEIEALDGKKHLDAPIMSLFKF